MISDGQEVDTGRKLGTFFHRLHSAHADFTSFRVGKFLFIYLETLLSTHRVTFPGHCKQKLRIQPHILSAATIIHTAIVSDRYILHFNPGALPPIRRVTVRKTQPKLIPRYWESIRAIRLYWPGVNLTRQLLFTRQQIFSVYESEAVFTYSSVLSIML